MEHPSRHVHDMVINKIRDQLSALKKEVETKQLQVVIQNQKVAIEKIDQELLFFTPERKAIIIIEEGKKKRQEEFVKALLDGNIGEAKKLKEQGASFKKPNSEGLCPLSAAVYGTNLEAVSYIENNLLESEAEYQWAQVDMEKAINEIANEMPEELRSGATYNDLGEWYKKVAGKKKFCRLYDEICLVREGNDTQGKIWGHAQDWAKRGDGVLAYQGGKHTIYNLNLRFETNPVVFCAPSNKLHMDLIKLICENLDNLRKKVEIKAPKQPKAHLKI